MLQDAATAQENSPLPPQKCDARENTLDCAIYDTNLKGSRYTVTDDKSIQVL